MNNNGIWDTFKFRDDDIVIASTIKSGTTWLQQIVAQLIFKGEFDKNLNNTSLWLDNLRNYKEDETTKLSNSQKHRRFFKTHSPANIVCKNDKIKYIFITRDFRDVVWSFYNHFSNSKYELNEKDINYPINSKLRNSENPYEFWRHILDNNNLFDNNKEYNIIWSYFNTVSSWINFKKKNILILHFNNLKEDLLGSIKTISNFLNLNYSDKLIEKVHNKCTFMWMKNNCNKCVPKHFEKNASVFINRGINKRWLFDLNENDIVKYNNLISRFFNKKTVSWIENGYL